LSAPTRLRINCTKYLQTPLESALPMNFSSWITESYSLISEWKLESNLSNLKKSNFIKFVKLKKMLSSNQVETNFRKSTRVKLVKLLMLNNGYRSSNFNCIIFCWLLLNRSELKQNSPLLTLNAVFIFRASSDLYTSRCWEWTPSISWLRRWEGFRQPAFEPWPLHFKIILRGLWFEDKLTLDHS
jgi:hypothetical protein